MLAAHGHYRTVLPLAVDMPSPRLELLPLAATRYALQFLDGESAASHGLKGDERFAITGLQDGAGKIADVSATSPDGSVKAFKAKVLLLTPKEVEYFRHGGILHYVLRQLASRKAA